MLGLADQAIKRDLNVPGGERGQVNVLLEMARSFKIGGKSFVFIVSDVCLSFYNNPIGPMPSDKCQLSWIPFLMLSISFKVQPLPAPAHKKALYEIDLLPPVVAIYLEIYRRYRVLFNKIESKRDNKKQAHQHNTFKLKLH